MESTFVESTHFHRCSICFSIICIITQLGSIDADTEKKNLRVTKRHFFFHLLWEWTEFLRKLCIQTDNRLMFWKQIRRHIQLCSRCSRIKSALSETANQELADWTIGWHYYTQQQEAPKQGEKVSSRWSHEHCMGNNIDKTSQRWVRKKHSVLGK